MNKHPQVPLEGLFIDVGMADILTSLWALGIKTKMSCQAREVAPGIEDMWISFSSSSDIEKFLEAYMLGSGQDPMLKVGPQGHAWFTWAFRVVPWTTGTFHYDVFIPLDQKTSVEVAFAKAAARQI